MLVSLAPTSSAKRRPANPPINLSTNCKAKIGTSIILYGMAMDGALAQKRTCLVKKKATFIIEVRTLSRSYPNVLKYMINGILILFFFPKVVFTPLNHGWWKLNGRLGMILTKISKWNVPA
jgi:hypothetical protein